MLEVQARLLKIENNERTAITASIDELGRRVSDLELAMKALAEIKSSIAVIGEKLANLPAPGVSPWCQSHTMVLNTMSKRVDEHDVSISHLKLQIAKWGGGLAVLVVVIPFITGIVWPVIKEILTHKGGP